MNDEFKTVRGRKKLADEGFLYTYQKRNKYRRADERILAIVKTYADREIIEYLRGLAHNFIME